MFKRVTMTLVLLASIGLTISPVSAAVDWNLDMLGFSSNSQFFVLAESVVEDGSGIARAKIIIADVATNRCVQGGCLESRGSDNGGDTEQDALQKIYQKTWLLRQKLELTPPQTGYLANGPFFGEDSNTAHYSYNDRKFYVTLLQKTVPGEDDFHKKAAVQITISTFNETGHVEKVLDSLNNYRENAQKYQLGRIYVSPDRKSVAILVHVFYRGFEGYDIRTIVQTVQLF